MDLGKPNSGHPKEAEQMFSLSITPRIMCCLRRIFTYEQFGKSEIRVKTLLTPSPSHTLPQFM